MRKSLLKTGLTHFQKQTLLSFTHYIIDHLRGKMFNNQFYSTRSCFKLFQLHLHTPDSIAPAKRKKKYL